MADGRHIENRLKLYLSAIIVQLTRNLEWWSRITLRDSHLLRDLNRKFRKFMMTEGRQLKMVISLPHRESSDFDKKNVVQMYSLIRRIVTWAIF